MAYSLALCKIILFCVSTSDTSFQGLGELPGGEVFSGARGISHDGQFIVGNTSVANGSDGIRGFIWSAQTGMSSIGSLGGGSGRSEAMAIADAGMALVGSSDSAASSQTFPEALIWTQSGINGLGDLPGGLFWSEATAVSADGQVVVGWGQTSSDREAFLWTAESGMIGLGFLPSVGTEESWGYDVSGDGRVTVGYSSSVLDEAPVAEAYRWSQESGMVGLGFHSGFAADSRAYGVSADGNTVVGEVGTEQAFKWTSESGIQPLGHLPGHDRSIAFATSSGGERVVGYSSIGGQATAFVWDSASGMRDLNVVLQELGLDLNGWHLRIAFDISADGRKIVGYGLNPNGFEEAWLAEIPTPNAIPTMNFWGAGVMLLLLILLEVFRSNTGMSENISSDCVRRVKDVSSWLTPL